MRSAWSVGLLMIVMAGVGISGIGGQRPIGPVPWGIAALLVVGGASMFLRRPFTFWIAIAAALLLTLSGLAARLGHPAWALPIPWGLSVVVGLYLILRAIMARPSMRPSARPSGESSSESD